MRKNLFIFMAALLLVALALLLPGGGAAQPAASEAAPIQLKVATFTPTQGERPDIPPGLAISEYARSQRGYYIVQFAGPVQEVWKAQVEATGAELLGYIPDYAFKVRMNPGQARRVERLDSVAWTGFYHPAYKISPHLGDAELLRVQLTGAADLAAMRAAIESLGVVVERAAGRSLTVRMDAAQAPDVARLLEVEWIQAEPEFKLYNNIAREGEGGMDAYTLWGEGVFGDGQIAAVADTGLDTNDPSTVHLDFRGRVVDIVLLGDLSTDSHGHGTHVAGSVLGNGVESGTDPGTQDYGQNDTTDPNTTTEKVTGIAPEAQIYFQAIACSHPFFGITLCGLPDDLNNLFQPAYDAGARVHSNSWGSDAAGDYTASSQDVDEFTWANQDMVVTFSAGNAGTDGDNDGYVDLDSMGSPATAKNAISVGASENARTNGGINEEDTTNDLDEVQCSGNNGGYAYRNCWPDDFDASPTGPDPVGGMNNFGHMAAFSSRGPTDDGRIKPDVVAPGTNILSTMSSQVDSCGWGPGELNNKYCMLGGTSMSNPLVAGAVTLVQDWYEDVKGHLNPSAALVKATLVNTAVDISGYGDSTEEAGQPIPNNHEGWGAVNLANVAADGREFVDGDSVSTDGVVTYSFDAPGSQAFKVTLVWTDYPGSTSASVTLVNDLDLTVTSPSSAVYRGNVFSSGWSQTGGSADRLNNVENVYVESAEAGTWTVEVSGFNVPNGPQPFALVVDGGGSTGTDSPPTVSITNPSDGETVSGSVTVTADASDDNGVTQVEFFVDGGSIGVDSDGSDGWSATWDTTGYADGSHTVEATATDTAGQTASDSISVTVDNIDSPPTVNITNPSDGETVSGSVTVTADASDDNGVTQVEFFVDGGSIGVDSDGSDGWSATWDTTGYADGSHTVEATATDTAGQTASDSISVTVDNSTASDTMHVGDLDGNSINNGSTWTAEVTILIVDGSGNAVSSATVDGTWSGPVSSTASCTTDSTGTCTVSVSGIHKRNSTVTFTVDNVTHDTLTYDSSANTDPDGDSDGTSITVAKP